MRQRNESWKNKIETNERMKVASEPCALANCEPMGGAHPAASVRMQPRFGTFVLITFSQKTAC